MLPRNSWPKSTGYSTRYAEIVELRIHPQPIDVGDVEEGI